MGMASTTFPKRSTGMKRALFVGALAALLMTATPAMALGANSDRNLKRATADFATQETRTIVEPESVTLTEVNRGMFRVRWQASAQGNNYACSADDMLREIQCVRLAPPAETAQTAALETQ